MAHPELITLLRLLPAAAMFLLPGWLLGRCLGTPAPLLTTFLGSAAILFNSILLLDAVRLPLSALSVGLLLALWSLLLAGRAWRHPPQAPESIKAGRILPRGTEWLWTLPVVVAATSLALRLVLDPLSGWDNSTRWDYLARLMNTQGSLAHYPPVSNADFLLYSWCDGIPPLVSTLNFWIYAVAGASAPVLTSLRVFAECALSGLTAFQLSRRLWGEAGGWPALAALATSSLLLWGSAMGQETGLLAVSFAGLCLMLTPPAGARDETAALWGGVAAGVGAISREYGLAFILFGGAILLGRRAGRVAGLRFALAAGFIAGPWYLRNWIVTGNPLFPHALGGLFPTNAIHTETMRIIAGYWGFGSDRFDLGQIGRMLGILAGPLLILGGIGALRAGRRGLVCAGGMGLIATLWWWAIPSTAGGWSYGSRVLVPALVLAGALSGWLAGLSRPGRGVFMLGFLILAADAGRRSWLLPQYPGASPWPYSFAPWRQDRLQKHQLSRPEVWDILVREAHGRGIVVDDPGNHGLITSRGGRAVPLFSPQIRAAFSRELSFQDIRRELVRQNVRFITLNASNPLSENFCRQYPFLDELTGKVVPTVSVQYLNVYDLDLLGSPP